MSDKLKKALTRQPNLYRKRDRDCELSTATVFSCDDEEAPPPAKIPNLSVPASRKYFLDLKLQTQHKRSDDLLKTIKDFLTKENEGYENPMSITQLLGYLIHTHNYSKDKKTAAIGMDIYKQEHLKKQQFSSWDAIALMHDLTLTKAQMRTMKGYLAEKGIFFPNKTALIEDRAQLRPVIQVEFDGDGDPVDYTALVKSTSSLIGMIQNKDPEAQPIDPSKPVVVVYKDGGDTAGSQTVWKSISMKDASDHLFQLSVVPLRVEQSGTVVWKNPLPNSAKSCRPVLSSSGI